MGLDLRILPNMGHLTTPDHLDTVTSLVAEVADHPTHLNKAGQGRLPRMVVAVRVVEV